MGRARKSNPIMIVCGYPGCGKSQTVRRSRVVKCDGYMCGTCPWPEREPPPGLAREIVYQAAGGFNGWRDVVLDDGQRISRARARRLALLACAGAVPRAETDVLVLALAGPAGRGRRHLLYVVEEGGDTEMSTGIEVTEDGRVELEVEAVVAVTAVLMRSGRTAGVLLRTFTEETAFLSPNGTPIPVKELRGWTLSDHVLRPLPAAELRGSLTTDPESGAPVPPERGVRYEEGRPVTWPLPGR